MTKSLVFCVAVLVVSQASCFAQVAGNLGFSHSAAKERAEQRERAKHVITKDEIPPSGSSMFVEADVLMNVKADEFVAVFGLSQEGETLAECTEKMDAQVKELTAALKELKIGPKEIYLDFITQSKIYGFEIQGDIAREKLVGFELKKNLSVHYKDRDTLDALVVAAAKVKVYDLIKVDYIVSDIGAVRDKLMELASDVVKQKIKRYEKLLGVKVQPPAQVYAERSAAHYPTQLYDSYVPAESESITSHPDRQKYTVQSARKSRTFVFNGLDGDGFDAVVNPVVVEPVVQCTLYLKVKYEVEQLKAK